MSSEIIGTIKTSRGTYQRTARLRGDPFEYDPDEIECTECLPVETMVVKYEPIKS